MRILVHGRPGGMHRSPFRSNLQARKVRDAAPRPLAGDADVLMMPAGVRGLVDDEAMDLLTSIADNLQAGRETLPCLGDIIGRG